MRCATDGNVRLVIYSRRASGSVSWIENKI